MKCSNIISGFNRKEYLRKLNAINKNDVNELNTIRKKKRILVSLDNPIDVATCFEIVIETAINEIELSSLLDSMRYEGLISYSCGFYNITYKGKKYLRQPITS